MTLPQGDVSSQYIYPASHMVSEGGIIPLGTRLRLKNTAQVNTLIAAMGPQAQIIAQALQQYGLILADVGSPMFVSGTSAAENATNGITLNWDMDDVLDLRALVASNFDVVSLKPIVTGLSPTNASPGSTLTINGTNFSGAAGNLSVFFGSAQASQVNVVSDNEVSLTVPSGTGTMNVTVQSGTNETDEISDSPNDNANAPIFGYGTSAVTVADKFTFSSPRPDIEHVTLSAGKFIVGGTNNNGPGGTYSILIASNLFTPLKNWTVLTNGSFDANGNFSFTNAIAITNAELFYILKAP
jgi:hypothetical protein